MAKRMNRNGPPKIPRIPDFRIPPELPNWEEYFDPRRAKRPAFDLVELVALSFDLNLFKSIFITNLIVNEVLAGLAGVNNKTANPVALGEWRSKLQSAVYARLQTGGDWNAEGANVLVVAHDMGTIAGLLSGGNGEAGPNQLKSAFAASKTHATCSAGSGVGGGAWCTFDWI